MYSIGDIAKLTGVKQSTLRYWENEFPQLSPQKNKFGHRVYINSDIEIVNLIKELLYLQNMSIKEAKVFLDGKTETKISDSSNSTNAKVLSEVRSGLTDILKMLRGVK